MEESVGVEVVWTAVSVSTSCMHAFIPALAHSAGWLGGEIRVFRFLQPGRVNSGSTECGTHSTLYWLYVSMLQPGSDHTRTHTRLLAFIQVQLLSSSIHYSIITL